MAPAVALLSALLIVGRLNSFSDVPGASYALVLAAPLLTTLATPALPREWPAWRRAAVLAGVLAVPLGVAILLAALA